MIPNKSSRLCNFSLFGIDLAFSNRMSSKTRVRKFKISLIGSLFVSKLPFGSTTTSLVPSPGPIGCLVTVCSCNPALIKFFLPLNHIKF